MSNGYYEAPLRQVGKAGQFQNTGSGATQAKQLAQLQQLIGGPTKMADGTKPIVVCRGVVTEAKDLDEAQRVAESEAHSKSADAYILKPFRRVSPKREVVSTDL